MPIFSPKKEEKESLNQELIIETEKTGKKAIEKAPEAVPTEIKKEEEEIKEREGLTRETGEQPTKAPIPPVTKTPPVTEIATPPKKEKSPILIEIEQILSENLDELYTSLSAEQKLFFKQKGEETASQIEVLLKEVKVNVNKMLTIIKEWLLMLVRLIPGVNKFFLIKEAKIKTDKILFLVEKRKKK